MRLKVKGYNQLKANLGKIQAGVNKQDLKMARDSLKVGLKEIQTEMRTRAPRDTGNLAKDIKIYAPFRPKLHKVSVFVGPNPSSKTYAFHAHFVEFGTADKREAVLVRPRGSKGGEMVRMKRGQKSRPFMTPAFNSKAQAAINAANVEFIKRFNKLLK